MSVVRAFISVDVPKNILREIVKIQENLPEFDGKFTETENLHLTLKFLGEIEEKTLDIVKENLRKVDFKAFETKINHFGFFDNRKSRQYSRKIVIWLHLTNCEGLQKAVDEALSGIFEREKRFMSHLTIARVKNIKNKRRFLEELEKIRVPSGLSFKVKSFNLKKSKLMPEGPVYDTIEEYFLT